VHVWQFGDRKQSVVKGLTKVLLVSEWHVIIRWSASKNVSKEILSHNAKIHTWLIGKNISYKSFFKNI